MKKKHFYSKLPFVVVITFLFIFLLTIPYLINNKFTNIHAQDECDVDVFPGAKKIYGDSVSPGSIVCVHAGTYTNTSYKLQFLNFVGTEGNPIRIVNKYGQVVVDVHGPLYLTSSNNVILDGSGTPGVTYGFKILDSSETGLSITQQKSTSGSKGYEISNIEAHHIEILFDTAKGNQGVGARNDDGAGPLENMNFHHFYIHRTSRTPASNSGMFTEGFYIGSSYYNSSNVSIVSGLKIHHNIVEESGWDGIQVGSASGGCDIYNNVIIRDSREFIDDQHSGIMNNPGSTCNIYHNKILESYGCGIYLQGIGNQHVYNNIVTLATSINPDPITPKHDADPSRNQLDPSSTETRNGICLSKQLDPKNGNARGPIYIYNNTVISNASITSSSIYAISVSDSNVNDFKIFNNLVSDSKNGIDNASNITKVYNNYNGSNALIFFKNYQSDDFHLTSQSTVAIDKGTWDSVDRAINDYDNNQRQDLPDLGAFEYGGTPAPPPEPTPSNELEFEAEDMDITGFLIGNDATASSGQYLQTSVRDSGIATYVFTVPIDGVYKVKGRVIADDTSRDSFFASIDLMPQDPSDIWDIQYEIPVLERSTSWSWDDVSRRGNGTFDYPQDDPSTFNLSAGTHTLYITGREVNTKLDKLLIIEKNKDYDVNDDGVIDSFDLKLNLQLWNTPSDRNDFNQDGVVNILDYTEITKSIQ